MTTNPQRCGQDAEWAVPGSNRGPLACKAQARRRRPSSGTVIPRYGSDGTQPALPRIAIDCGSRSHPNLHPRARAGGRHGKSRFTGSRDLQPDCDTTARHLPSPARTSHRATLSCTYGHGCSPGANQEFVFKPQLGRDGPVISKLVQDWLDQERFRDHVQRIRCRVRAQGGEDPRSSQRAFDGDVFGLAPRNGDAAPHRSRPTVRRRHRGWRFRPAGSRPCPTRPVKRGSHANIAARCGVCRRQSRPADG